MRIHMTIVRYCFPANPDLDYYVDTRALKRNRPFKYYNRTAIQAAQNTDSEWAGNLDDLMKLNDRRWAATKKKRRTIHRDVPTLTAEERETFHENYARFMRDVVSEEKDSAHVARTRRARAINEINECWLDPRQPSFAAIKPIQNREWQAAELVFSHA